MMSASLSRGERQNPDITPISHALAGHETCLAVEVSSDQSAKSKCPKNPARELVT